MSVLHMHKSLSVWPLTWAAVQTRPLLLAHLQANAATNEEDTVHVPGLPGRNGRNAPPRH